MLAITFVYSELITVHTTHVGSSQFSGALSAHRVLALDIASTGIDREDIGRWMAVVRYKGGEGKQKQLSFTSGKVMVSSGDRAWVEAGDKRSAKGNRLCLDES